MTPSNPHGLPKASPRTSKFLNWSKLAQAGDSSTTPRRLVHRRVGRRMLNRRFQRAGNLVGNRLAERRGEGGAASPIR
jgi:hypothetical protein